MNYGEIKKTDIANGFGVRVSLFVSGCSHRCQDCFNSETWDFSYGQPFTAQTEEELLEALAPGFVNGLTLLGGDPFEISNQRALLPFLRRVKKAFPGKDIWCYTGAVLDRDLIPDGHYFCEATEEMLSLIDVLVDGPFVVAQKDITLRFRGSSNQRLIDMKETRQAGKIIPWDKQF